MINSHKELVAEIENFSDKFDLIKSFYYVKDSDKLAEEVQNKEARILMISISNVKFDDENYNQTATYRFILADETMYDDKSIIQSESDNMDTISSLNDYLNYIAESPIELNDVKLVSEAINENVYTTISGSFDFIIKRKPSYWKKMEEYSV